MSTARFVTKAIVASLAAPLAMALAAPAQAQTLADLDNFEEVAPIEPTVLDGVWKVVGLQKQILIENGHAIALEGWVHALFWTVEPGMVTSTQIRQTGDGRFEAYDALLKRPMKWTLKPDGTVFASGTGLFAPSFYLEPIELAYPGAFEEELAALDGGGRIGAPPPGIIKPGPPVGGPPERPGPLDIDQGMTYSLQTGNSLCLDVRRSQLGKQGAEVISWKCHGGSNQKFFFFEEEGLIVTAGGMCLEAVGTKKGSRIKAYGCDGNAMQQWKAETTNIEVPGFGNIQPVKGSVTRFTHSSGKCLDLSRTDMENKKNGGKIMLWNCHDGKNQGWATLSK